MNPVLLHRLLACWLTPLGAIFVASPIIYLDNAGDGESFEKEENFDVEMKLSLLLLAVEPFPAQATAAIVPRTATKRNAQFE